MEPEKDQIVPIAVDEDTWAKYNRQYVLRSLWDPDEYIRQVRFRLLNRSESGGLGS